MTLFRPFRESPDAADFDRDEKRFNDASEYVDAIVARGTLLREVPRLEKKASHAQADRSAESG